MTALEKRYAGFHLLRCFFEDLDRWREEITLTEAAPSLTREQYDMLFRGTWASVYVPVWASACLSGTDILLNEITLEVVLFYKRYGYAPVRMEGNPPDYLGEQFRFLEYLFRAAADGDGEAERAAQEFIQDFAMDTFRCMAKEARRSCQNDELEAVFRLAEACLLDGKIPLSLSEEQLARLDSRDWKRQPPIPVEPPRWVSHASFNDCGSKCKMMSRVQEGCVLEMRPDKNTPLHFAGCPRGAAYRGTFLNSRRLRYPMERVGKRGEGRFRRISWDEAAQKVADIVKVSHREGVSSRYVMGGAGNRGVMRGSGMITRLLALDGGYLNYYSSYSIGAALPVIPRIFGRLRVANHESEMLRSQLLLLWGNNLVTNHYGSAQKRVLMQARRQGVKIVVIDPRQSDTALAAADRWIPIRPGTDAALADAMCRVIWKKGLHDQAFLDRYCVGFDEAHLPEGVPAGESYCAYLDGVKDGIPKTPQWAERITGIPAETVEALAVEYATAKYACILPGLGPQRTLNGEQTYRSILTLPCVAGNLAKPGGGLITWSHAAGAQPWLDGADNPVKTSIPTFQWWRAVECPETLDASRGLRNGERLEQPVRYLFSFASGMLMNQHSDTNHTLRILQTEGLVEAVVLTDLFMTPGARIADLLLPAPSFFETDNIVGPWGAEDYVLYNHAALEPLFGCRIELSWLTETAEKLGLKEPFCGGKRDLEDWLRESWDNLRTKRANAPDFETFRRDSIAVFPFDGPTISFFPEIGEGKPFATPSGKIEIFCKELYEKAIPGIPGVPGYVPAEEGAEDPARETYPLQLIAFHSKRRCHSIHEQNQWLDEIEPPRLWIHPRDAAERNIHTGDAVEAFNARGCCRLPAWVTERIAPGVTAMAEGAWYTPDADGVDTRGSINVLTLSHRATPLGNANPQHTNLVQVRLAAEPERR